MMKRQIIGSIHVGLHGSQADLHNSLYAINWFDTRMAWLYHLYNKLAIKDVLAVGATPFFKGEVCQRVHGVASSSRRFLLIVRYPNGNSFLDLLVKRRFQALSLLRMLAIKKFSFVLHRRRDTVKDISLPSMQVGMAYAVHHFASSQSMKEEVNEILALMPEVGVRLRLASEVAAPLASKSKKKGWKIHSYLTQKVILWEADEKATLQGFLIGTYAHYAKSRNNSFVGMLNRTY